MSKAYLIMDMPESCQKCDLWNILKCYEKIDVKEIKTFNEKRIAKCPLRDVPDKEDYDGLGDYDDIHADGWNACIDEILGGAE